MTTYISILCLASISCLTALKIERPEVFKQNKTEEELVSGTQNVLRQACKGKQSCWILWMGDSNMRNTYKWWTNARLQPQSVIFEKSRQFGQEYWVDQDTALQYKDGFKIRSSFRFLHGSAYEFQFKLENPHKGSMHETKAAEDKLFDQGLFENMPNITYDDADAIQPSKYAQMVTSKQKLIDWKVNNAALAQQIEEYEHKSPDIVILTEGWGGIPGCERFQEALDLMRQRPQTKFVWAPLYVTNRSYKRYNCFKPKMQDETKHPPNVKMVDNGDWLTKYGEEIPVRDPGSAAGIKVVHIGAGGKIMSEGVKRFEVAIDTLSN